jgi:hypothetical protein
MKKTPILLSLSILTIYACTCVSAVQFNPGPLDEECLEAGIEDWIECEEFLNDINVCEPDCEEWQECGDDGCGGECGRCPNAAPFCNDGTCEQVCEPDCDDKECGDDGCGDVCGNCPGAAPFCIEFLCNTEEPNEPDPEECVPNCENRECGPDGCEGQCGICEESDICVYSPGASECIAEEETSSCEGLCGGFTGSCWCDEACFINEDCCDDVCDFCSEDEAIAKKCAEARAE